MPTYEYLCGNCDKHHEAFQKISDDPLTKCPHCGAEALERLVSRSSFSLKGDGWYSDGYGASGKKSSPPAPKSSGESKTESSSESKTDKKPDTAAPKTDSKKSDT